MHLQSLNSHVEIALRECQVHYGIVGVIPRQEGPLQVEYSKHVVGTSSFGMSGINAHMLVRARSTTKTKVIYNVNVTSGLCFCVTCISGISHYWHSNRLLSATVQTLVPAAFNKLERLWPLPEIYVLLKTFGGRDNTVAAFEFNLPSSATSFLSDHKIYGRTILSVGTLLDMTMEGSCTLLGVPSMSTLCMQSSSTGVTKQIKSWADTLFCHINIPSGDVKIIGSSTHLTSCVRKLTKLKASGISNQHMVVAKALPPKEHLSSGFAAHPSLLHAIITAQNVPLGNCHSNFSIGTTCAAICIVPNEHPQDGTHIMCMANRQQSSHLRSNTRGNPCIVAQGYKTIKLSQIESQHWQERCLSTSCSPPTLRLSYDAHSLALAKFNMPITSIRWLILCKDDLCIASICTCLDMPLALTTVSLTTTRAAFAYGVHIGDEEDFIQLLRASEADKCLLAQDTFDTEVERHNRGAHGLAALAMLWAYRAFARAQPHYKLCTISITDGLNPVQPLSIFLQGMLHTRDVKCRSLPKAILYSLRFSAPRLNLYMR